MFARRVWRSVYKDKLKSGIALLLCVCLVMTGILFAEPSYSASDVDEVLGELIHYNGFIFGDFKATQADIEGALAVQGDGAFGTAWGQYDVGASAHKVVMGQYNNPQNYPTLLLKGKPTIGIDGRASWINIYGGPVVMSDTQVANYNASYNKFSATKGVKFLEDARVSGFFEKAYNTAVHTTQALDNAYKTEGGAEAATVEMKDFVGWSTSYKSKFGDLSKFQPDNLKWPSSHGNPKILVINVKNSGNVTLNAPHIPDSMGAYDLIIFNFPNASGAVFEGASLCVNGAQVNTTAPVNTWGSDVLHEYSAKVVWNFPSAGTISVNGGGVVGSVIAPYAYVKGVGGSINGMLVAQSFSTENGMELHSFYMNRNIFEFGNDEEEEKFGSVEIYKFDAGNTVGQNTFDMISMLRGVEFTLYSEKDNSPVNSGLTNEQGYLKFEDIPYGEYYLRETKTPAGYITMEDHHFVIDDTHGVASPLVFNFENKQKSIDVELRKVAELIQGGTPTPAGDETGDRKKAPLFPREEEGAEGEGEGGPDGSLEADGSDDTGGSNVTDGGQTDSPQGLPGETEYQNDQGTSQSTLTLTAAVGAGSLQDRRHGRISAEAGESGGAGGESEESGGSSGADSGSVGSGDGSEAGASGSGGEGAGSDGSGSDESGGSGQSGTDGQGGADGQNGSEPGQGSGQDGNEDGNNDQDGQDDDSEGDPKDGSEVESQDDPFQLLDVADGLPDGQLTGLAGAKFNLYKLIDDSQDNIVFVDNVYSGDDGLIEIKDLTLGTYALHEVDVPNGYQLMDEDHYIIILVTEEGGELKAVCQLYDREKGTFSQLDTDSSGTPLILNEKEEEPEPDEEYTIVVTKLDAYDLTPLQNVQFEVTVNVNGVDQTFYKETNRFGQAQFINVPAGSYTVKEVSIDGYNPCLQETCLLHNCDIEAHKEYTITVNPSDEDHVHHFTFYNKPYGEIEIKKVNYTSDAKDQYIELDGAEFTLYYDDGITTKVVDTKTTGEDGTGIVKFVGLKPGKYHAVETKVPDGYMIDPDDSDKLEWEIGGEGEGGGEKIYCYTFSSDPAKNHGTIINNKENLYRALFRKVDDSLFEGDNGEETGIGIPQVEFELFQLNMRTSDMTAYIPKSKTDNKFVSDGEGYVEVDGLTAGRYLLREVKAADGYAVVDANNVIEILFTVGAVGPRIENNNVYYIANRMPVPETNLKILKVDSTADNNPLKGAEFALYLRLDDSVTGDPEQNVYVEHSSGLFTDENGVIAIDGLDLGTYKLTEVRPPAGYEILSKYKDVHFEVVRRGDDPDEAEIKLISVLDNDVSYESINGDDYYTITIINQAPEEFPNISVRKVDADYRDKGLNGAHFIMFKKLEVPVSQNPDGYIWDYYANVESREVGGVDGVIEMPGVTVGSYRLAEVRTPDGYVERGIEFDFEVVEEQGNLAVIYNGDVIPKDGEEIPLVIINYKEERLGEFTVIKVDSDHGSRLDGAVFNLYRKNGGAKEYLVRIDADDPAEPYIGIPTFSDQGIPLPLTTPVGGEITVKNLPFDTYYLEEVTPPYGYVGWEPGDYETIIIDGESVAKTYYIGNTKTGQEAGTGKLKVIKRDGETFLAGAEFYLIAVLGTQRELKYYGIDESTGDVVWLPDTDGAVVLITGLEGTLTVDDLPLGRYILVEKTPPKGYESEAAEFPFLISVAYKDGDETTITYQTVINHKIPTTSITVTKYGEDRPGEGVPDMKFVLKKILSVSDEVYYESVDDGIIQWTPDEQVAYRFTTGGNGSITITGLTAGDYVIKEVEAPPGYGTEGGFVEFTVVRELDGDLSVVETNSGKPFEGEIPVTNKRNTGDLIVKKVSKGSPGQLLEGAQFILHSVTENQLYKNGGDNQIEAAADEDDAKAFPFVTEADGTVLIKYLPPGQYQLIETAAPAGYSLPDNPVYPFTVKEVSGEYKLYEGDGTSDVEIPDATIEIENAMTGPGPNPDPDKPFRVKKVSSETGEALKGAEFVLKNSGGKYYKLTGDVVTWVGSVDDATVLDTDEDGLTADIKGLAAGTYTLVEIQAPADHEITGNGEITFELTYENGEAVIKVAGTAVATDPVDGAPVLTVKNDPSEDPGPDSKKTMRIKKISSSSSGKVLSGAEFVLKTVNGSGVEVFFALADGNVTWVEAQSDALVLVTNQYGLIKLTDLDEGAYTLVEIKAPSGYKLPANTETTFHVTYDADDQAIVTVDGETLETEGGSPVLKIKNDESLNRRRRPSPDPDPKDPEEPEEPKDPEEPDSPDDPDPYNPGEPDEDWNPRDPAPPSGGDELDQTPKTGEMAFAIPFLFFNLLACGYLVFHLRGDVRGRRARYRGRHRRS